MRASRRERGVALVSMVTVLGTFLVVGIVGWHLLMTRDLVAQTAQKKQAYLQEVRQSLEAYLAREHVEFSRPSTVTSPADLVARAGISVRYGLVIEVSDSLVTNGLPWRAVAAYLPTDTDDVNPLPIAGFRATGALTSCVNGAQPCDPQKVVVASSLPLQQRAAERTTERLKALTLRAQGYFKARVLPDPEKRVTVNYFLPLSGDCNLVTDIELPCVDAYTSLSSSGAVEVVRQLLGVGPAEIQDGWGGAIEFRNGPYGATASSIPPGPETVTPPFSVHFRSTDPYGTVNQMVATQSLQ